MGARFFGLAEREFRDGSIDWIKGDFVLLLLPENLPLHTTDIKLAGVLHRPIDGRAIVAGRLFRCGEVAFDKPSGPDMRSIVVAELKDGRWRPLVEVWCGCRPYNGGDMTFASNPKALFEVPKTD